MSLMQTKFNKTILFINDSLTGVNMLVLDTIEAFYKRNRIGNSLFKLINTRADFAMKNGNIAEAIKLHRNALSLLDKTSMDGLKSNLQLAEILLESDRLIAFNQLIQTIEKVKPFPDNPEILELYFNLKYRLYRRNKNDDSSFHYLNKYHDLRYLLVTRKADESLQETMVLHEVELKQHQIKQLATQNLLIRSENTRYRQIGLFLIFLLLMLGLITWQLRRIWNQKIVINQQKREMVKIELRKITLEKQQLKHDLELKKREAMIEAIMLTERSQLMQSVEKNIVLPIH